MKHFAFRLQSVLELRERTEKDAASRLTQARDEEVLAQQAHQDMERAHTRARTDAADAASLSNGIPAGELHFYRTVLEHLEHRSVEAALAASDAGAQVTRSSEQYDHAVRERTMLNRLEERHREAWEQMVLAGDRNAMDAVALTRYMSGRMP